MSNNIINRLNKVLGTLNDSNLTDVAYKKFKDITPIRSGNAKRNTTKTNNSIEANYPYAEVLDKGRHMTSRGMRGSDQAPIGMTKPTIEHVRKYIQQQLNVTVRKG